MAKYEMSIMEEELIKALNLPQGSESGLTMAELMEALDYRVGENTIHRRLNSLIRQGRVKFAGWRNVPEVTGRRHPRPVYELVKTGEEGV